MDTETINLRVKNMRNSFMNSIRDIEYSIGSKRQMAKKRRDDQLNLLQETSSIAVKLGFKDRVDSRNVVQNNQPDSSATTTPPY